MYKRKYLTVYLERTWYTLYKTSIYFVSTQQVDMWQVCAYDLIQPCEIDSNMIFAGYGLIWNMYSFLLSLIVFLHSKSLPHFPHLAMIVRCLDRNSFLLSFVVFLMLYLCLFSLPLSRSALLERAPLHACVLI